MSPTDTKLEKFKGLGVEKELATRKPMDASAAPGSLKLLGADVKKNASLLDHVPPLIPRIERLPAKSYH
jgi:hypothetical protein